MAIAGTLQVNLVAKTDQLQADLTKAQAAIKRLQEQAKEAKGGLEQMGQGASQLETALGGVGKAALGLGAGILSLTALKSALSDVIQTGTAMQSLRNSFTAFTGDAGRGRQEMAFVVDTSNKLGLELQGTAQSYRSLSAATRGTLLEGQATKELFTALTGAARTYGLSTEQTGRALTAFEQIVSKGKVSQEELRGQLAEAIPGATQIAARAFGVSTKALEDLVAKGLDATVFVKAFTAQLQKEAPVATDAAGAGVKRLGNEISLLKDRIAQSGILTFFDKASDFFAQALKQGRTASEEHQAGTRRAATRALGGEDPTKMLGGDVQQLLAVSEQLAKAEERLRSAQERLAAARGLTAGRGAFSQGTSAQARAVNLAQGEVDQLRQQQTELAAVVKPQDAQNKQTKERANLLTEVGDQYDAQLRAEEKARQAEPGQITERFKEIQGRTEAALKDQEAAEERGKEAKREAEAARRTAEQLAQQQARELEQSATAEVQRLKEIEAEQERLYESLDQMAKAYSSTKLARDEDTASLTASLLVGTQWEERAKARNKIVQDSAKVLAMVPKLQADAARSAADWAQQQAGQAQLDRYEELLGMADGRRITPAMRRYQRAETDLAPVLAAGGAAAERARTVLRQLKPEFVQLQAVAEEFSQSFLSTIEAAATGGIKSFKAFADSVIMDLARILQRQYLAPALSELIGKGLQAGLSALGLAGGITANPTQYSAPIGPTLSGAPMAEGGPVMPGKFYTVGERGREYFVSGVPGQIVPPDQMPRGGVTIHGPLMVVNTPDAGSFRRSSGEVDARLLNLIRQAQRNA